MSLPFKVVSPEFVQGKNVLLRLDLDVPIQNGKIMDDFRLLAGMDTLGLCLEFANSVIICGHIGRPGGKEDPNLTVKPVVDWIEEGYGHIRLPQGKLHILENLRFEPGEEACDPQFARELASYGDVFINEAFASYHPSASTTVLPTLLPHAAGTRFADEVEVLTHIRQNPKRPFVAIMGGAKVEDKLPVIKSMAQIADAVLVGGKLALELKSPEYQYGSLGANVLIAKMTEDGEDISEETVSAWKGIIAGAKMVIWNGPLGKFENPKNDRSKQIARTIIATEGQESIVGGGDTLSALTEWGFIDKFSFVSTGGGAMLKFLEKGTLPTIEALK